LSSDAEEKGVALEILFNNQGIMAPPLRRDDGSLRRTVAHRNRRSLASDARRIVQKDLDITEYLIKEMAANRSVDFR
jgi:hypothetical protein